MKRNVSEEEYGTGFGADRLVAVKVDDMRLVHEHVEHDFEGEDAALERLRWASHDVWCGDFEAEAHVWHA